MNLDKTQFAHHAEYMIEWNIRLDLDATNAETLTTAQESALIEVTENGYTQASGFALSLLLQYTGYEYSEPLTPSSDAQLRNYSVKDETMAIEELMVYPNPTSDLLMVNIISPIVTTGELRILDLQGKAVLLQTVQSTLQNQMVDVSNFAVGKYQLEWIPQGLPAQTTAFEIVR